jgi:hypothetical protein
MERILSLCAGILCLSGLVFAQDTRGPIQGTIRDPQGAVVGGVDVAVTNIETGVSVRLKSNVADGRLAPREE